MKSHEEFAIHIPVTNPLMVPYGDVCRALGHAISNMARRGDPWNSAEMWTIVTMLCQEMPEWDWSNAISDHFR